MRKRIIIIGIIIFSIVTVGILVISPTLIESSVKSNSQWIPFYASYLGGIFGGIVSGSLTLGGVYLTIRHQNKLLNQEKAAKISYICRTIKTEYTKLNKCILDRYKLNAPEHVNRVKQQAKHFVETIENNKKYVMETDFYLINHVESLTDLLKNIIDYGHDKSNIQILEEFKRTDESIRYTVLLIIKYDGKFR